MWVLGAVTEGGLRPVPRLLQARPPRGELEDPGLRGQWQWQWGAARR